MSMREELRGVEERFMRAVAERDMPYLDEHLAPEFKLVTGRPGHELRERAEWLAVTATGYVIEEFSFDALDVVDLDDVAVVRSRYRQRGSMDGADRSQPFLMTDVWRRAADDWRLVTRHISPLPAD